MKKENYFNVDWSYLELLRKKLEITTRELSKQLGRSESYYVNAKNALQKLPENIIASLENILKTERANFILSEDKVPVKKPVKNPAVYIQSIIGGTITVPEILEKVREAAPDAKEIYVKTEENAAYWVSDEDSGAVNLWD